MQKTSNLEQIPSPGPTRSLREEERLLILSLLSGARGKQELEKTLSTSLVTDMLDGGMGSIRFVRTEPRTFGRALVETQYTDADGVLITIAVNVDTYGDLFELDFWKTDFSALRRYPTPSDLKPTTKG